MQARERELLQAREEANEFALRAQQTESTVQAILDTVPNAEQFERGFSSVFSALPEQAQAAIQHEFTMPVESPARPASEGDVARFGSTPEGRELLSELGRNAGYRVATIRARVERMLSGGDMDAAARWLDGLSSAEAKSVWRRLTGS